MDKVAGWVRPAPMARLTTRGDRDVEWSFVAAHLPGAPLPPAPAGRCLDLGPGESWLSLIAARKGWDVVALDRLPLDPPWRHPRVEQRTGDVLVGDPLADLEPLDVAIACSTVEHVGLPGRYEVVDAEPDGDLRTMARVRQVLKRQSPFLVTIPVGTDVVVPPRHRVYGHQRLPLLLEGWEVEVEEFWHKDPDDRWVPTDRTTALRVVADPQGPSFFALACYVLRRP